MFIWLIISYSGLFFYPAERKKVPPFFVSFDIGGMTGRSTRAYFPQALKRKDNCIIKHCGAPQAVRRFFRFFHSDVSVSHFAVEVFHRIADIERRRDGERVLVDVVTRVVLGDTGIRFVRIA